MYLLVFTTLVISLLGIYTQVLAVEVARLAAQQSGVGAAMLTWHSAAVSMAASILDTNQYDYVHADVPAGLTYSFCSLGFNAPDVTIGTTTDALHRCTSPTKTYFAAGAGTAPSLANGNYANVTGSVCAGNGVITSSGTPTPPWQLCQISHLNLPLGPTTIEPVHLPADFQTGNYQFYSVLFKSGVDLVVTFVPKAAVTTTNPAGLLTLPNGAQIGLTSSDLLHQIGLASQGRYLYGYVSGSTLYVGYGANNTSVPGAFTYTLPAALNNTDGAVAIVSSPDGL